MRQWFGGYCDVILEVAFTLLEKAIAESSPSHLRQANLHRNFIHSRIGSKSAALRYGCGFWVDTEFDTPSSRCIVPRYKSPSVWEFGSNLVASMPKCAKKCLLRTPGSR
jgi:hypothetical protein